MTPAQIQLVRTSFAKVAPIADSAAKLFYGRLFELDPSLRHLFKSDMDSQGNKLMAMIGGAVSLLDQPQTLLPVVESLGRRHVGYGVEDQHYETVGSALMWTLEKGLGAEFTLEVETAWVAAYQMLSTNMKNASVGLFEAA